ncbi:hypothetical protein [uncultured Paraglaciecola sp.]|uniref:hypothetical protein n=1 Tax=uncultured Paraglaciecola sp. TaxID=1765024 RepID=UPI0025F01E78|nr:hypothetical protein [uncultured Paraglaciecola sp.]
MTEKPFLVSGSNKIIHKIRKLDLLNINGEDNPSIVVSHKGIKEFLQEVPYNKRDAKQLDLEMVQLTSSEVFGEEKTLLFVQTINGKEYKVDYSKHGTPLFIRIHQENAF